MAYTPVELTRNGKTTVAQTIEEEVELRFDGWVPTGSPTPDDSWDVVRHQDLRNPTSKPATDLKALFATQARGNILELAARLPRELRPFIPTLTPTAVTVSESATQTITSSFREFGGLSPQITPLGTVPTLNTTSNYVYNAANGPDGGDMSYGTQLIGDTVEFAWRARIAGTKKFWIFINGQPTTLAPFTTALTVNAGGTAFLKLVFPSVGLWDVRIYTEFTDLFSVRIPATQGLTSCPARPLTIAMVGDSYGQQVADSSNLQVWPRILADLLGAEELRACQPGTGFTKDGGGGNKGVFGDPRRLDAIAAGNPRLVIGVGGTNDNLADPADLKTKATAFFAGLATRLPKVPVIWFGPQALNYTATVASSAVAAQNKAIRDACLASPNVLSHVDMIGHAATGVVPPSWVNGGAISAGDLRVYQGAIYKAVNFTGASTMGAAGPDRNYYQLLSWLTGTGTAGAPTGDGTRDLFLSSDGTHPTHLGQENIAARAAAETIRIIRAAALSVQ